MKILITGADGQLGQELVKVFANEEVIATDFHNLDITDSQQVNSFFRENKPAWIINSAAYTNVEGAAKDPTVALRVNGEGTRNLALAAKEINAKLVYISTNEVFDGKKTSPYDEEDSPQPINPYGGSKLAGETACQEILAEKFIIARTAWLYGPASSVNFPNKIIARARETGKLEVVDDELSTPTYAPDLALWIKDLISQNEKGIFHLVNDGFASRFEWAKEIIETLKIEVDLKPTKLADYPRLSTPPAKSILSNQKAKNAGLKMRSWQQASAEYLKTLS